MEHVAAILLLIGCSDGTQGCRELPAPTPIYETAEACTAGLGSALASVRGYEGRVVAKCVAVDPEDEEMDATLVWDFDGSGNLVASIEPVEGDVMIATDSTGTPEVNQQ